MKKFFCFSVLFSAGICIVCILPSCNVALIRITGSDITTGDLVMEDKEGNAADTVRVNPEQTIIWRIKKSSGVSSITDIFPKSGPHTVIEEPDKKFLSKSWKAKVHDSEELEHNLLGTTVGGYVYYTEDYNISWKHNNDTTTRTYDPRIKVKSRISGGG